MGHSALTPQGKGRCKMCGSDLTGPGATFRTSLGRRCSKRHGWHNATAGACSNCHTLLKWDTDLFHPAMPYTTDEVVEYAQAHGSHFFDRDTMRFFGSRVATTDVWIPTDRSCVCFITSERDRGPYPAWSGERRYTVRAMYPGAEFDELGDFGAFDTLRQARAAIKRAVAEYNAATMRAAR